jgi:hypothetical protein
MPHRAKGSVRFGVIDHDLPLLVPAAGGRADMAGVALPGQDAAGCRR